MLKAGWCPLKTKHYPCIVKKKQRSLSQAESDIREILFSLEELPFRLAGVSFLFFVPRNQGNSSSVGLLVHFRASGFARSAAEQEAVERDASSLLLSLRFSPSKYQISLYYNDKYIDVVYPVRKKVEKYVFDYRSKRYFVIF